MANRKLSRMLSMLLILQIVISLQVHAQGKGMATAGTMVGGALVMVGGVSLVKDVSACSTGTGCAKIPMDLLEIAGGALAMMNNAQTAGELDGGLTAGGLTAGGLTAGGLTAGGTSNGGTSNGGTTGPDYHIPTQCELIPDYCKINPDNNRPNLNLPPLADIRDVVTKNWGRTVSPDGKSLQEALDEIDTNYDKAAKGVAAFNAASNAGGLDPGFGEASELAGDGGDGQTGIELNRAIAGTNPDGSESVNFPGMPPMSMDNFLDKLKKDRPAPIDVKAVGLNLEDRDGRLLTIFERLSRAIRGTRNRDLLLAKVEWSRKEAQKKITRGRASVKTKKDHKVAISTDKN